MKSDPAKDFTPIRSNWQRETLTTARLKREYEHKGARLLSLSNSPQQRRFHPDQFKRF
jgi:hypothetical protein